ncbi:MAG: TIGR04211 family SH3 domain-containing protein [Deltaproteobacteria bacterium]|nr:TIGR04211 family SH3 domain-containing protein [Deltaproteobacteria bacterium]
MKTRLFCLCSAVALLFCFIGAEIAAAAEWYVKPTTEVLLRRGQGSDYKIDAVISDGTKVERLEVDGDWAKIQLANGKVGWTLRRYLSDKKPLKDQVAELEQEKRELEEKLAETNNRLVQLTDVNSGAAQDLNACLVERDGVKSDFERLQQDTTDVVQTKELLVITEKRLSEMSERLVGLEVENTEMKKNSSMRWFLTGGGVLVFGLFLGLIVGKRSKRRYGSLM